MLFDNEEIDIDFTADQSGLSLGILTAVVVIFWLSSGASLGALAMGALLAGVLCRGRAGLPASPHVPVSRRIVSRVVV